MQDNRYSEKAPALAKGARLYAGQSFCAAAYGLGGIPLRGEARPCAPVLRARG